MKPIPPLSDDELADLARRAEGLEDAPEHVIRRAIDVWQAPPLRAGELARAIVSRVKAALTFDSWAAPGLAFGMRNVPSASDMRQLLFSAHGRDLDIRITPAAHRFEVSGQILGPDVTGSIELLPVTSDHAVQQTAASAVVDELGEFHLSDVVPGTYTLVLRVTDIEIELPAFEIGERYR